MVSQCDHLDMQTCVFCFEWMDALAYSVNGMFCGFVSTRYKGLPFKFT